jgi:cysteinyl-tRNA synthetase
MASSETLTKSIAEVAQKTLENFQNILGLVIPKISDDEINSINDLIKKREMLREQKKFEDADKIRSQIADMGVELIDHKSRTTWIKKEKIKSDR